MMTPSDFLLSDPYACEHSVSMADAKPNPTEIPVTLHHCRPIKAKQRKKKRMKEKAVQEPKNIERKEISQSKKEKEEQKERREEEGGGGRTKCNLIS